MVGRAGWLESANGLPYGFSRPGAALHRRLPSGGTTDLADNGGETFGAGSPAPMVAFERGSGHSALARCLDRR